MEETEETEETREEEKEGLVRRLGRQPSTPNLQD